MCFAQGQDGLPGLAQAHVVSQDGPLAAEEKGDTLDLMGVQAGGKGFSALLRLFEARCRAGGSGHRCSSAWAVIVSSIFGPIPLTFCSRPSFMASTRPASESMPCSA
jgi:hypothetical protein